LEAIADPVVMVGEDLLTWPTKSFATTRDNTFLSRASTKAFAKRWIHKTHLLDAWEM
jgi:hypothetical protein